MPTNSQTAAEVVYIKKVNKDNSLILNYRTYNEMINCQYLTNFRVGIKMFKKFLSNCYRPTQSFSCVKGSQVVYNFQVVFLWHFNHRSLKIWAVMSNYFDFVLFFLSPVPLCKKQNPVTTNEFPAENTGVCKWNTKKKQKLLLTIIF